MLFHSHRNSPAIRQTGRGIGSFFAKIISALKRFVLPNVKKFAKSEIGKTVGQTAAESAISFGSDLISGKDPKEAGKDNLKEGIKKIQDSVSKLMMKKGKEMKKINVKRKKNTIKTNKGRSFFDP